MLDHMMINVTDFERSRAFYQAALAPLGFVVSKQIPVAAGFGVPHGHGKSSDPAGEFWISQGPPQEPRLHVAFNAASRALVDEFFARALAAGGRDNGRPGVRPQYHANYYGAFVLDPDGYNVEAVCHLAP
ncbi:MAG TPA: VOC family protein [Candidatus Sulfotelmatobacter sp.]|nr:VOC family protein [Candidatus Sulfotelmatobacter sp.]